MSLSCAYGFRTIHNFSLSYCPCKVTINNYFSFDVMKKNPAANPAAVIQEIIYLDKFYWLCLRRKRYKYQRNLHGLNKKPFCLSTSSNTQIYLTFALCHSLCPVSELNFKIAAIWESIPEEGKSWRLEKPFLGYKTLNIEKTPWITALWWVTENCQFQLKCTHF